MREIHENNEHFRWLATLTCAVSLASLLLQYVILVRSTLDTVGPMLATVCFFSYFTILSNILVVLVTSTGITTAQMPRFFARADVRGAAALYIGVTARSISWSCAISGSRKARSGGPTPACITRRRCCIWHGGCSARATARLHWRDIVRWLPFPLVTCYGASHAAPGCTNIRTPSSMSTRWAGCWCCAMRPACCWWS